MNVDRKAHARDIGKGICDQIHRLKRDQPLQELAQEQLDALRNVDGEKPVLVVEGLLAQVDCSPSEKG